MATVGIAVQGTPEFASTFEALTNNKPYPWQEELFHRLLTGPPPPDINLPTGAGKTSIIPIWLIALGYQAAAGAIALPRRQVWVVNRRVVVDQATDDAINLRHRLNEESDSPEVSWLRKQFEPLRISGDDVLAISTLRGELEDNREWSRDPAKPAIIIGTVDMIGSRLLFSGYGDSRYWRAQHAGLLGHDSLIINDEAHLSPAFASLLKKIEAFQNDSLKPFRTIRLSATHSTSDCWPKSLEKNQADERFRKVFETRKKLFIQNVPNAKVDQTIIDLAAESGKGRTVVFVTSPEKAQKIAVAIRNKVAPEAGKRVLTLTGTMRGFERDQLIKKNEFKPFTEKTRSPEDYWLVATSAGEVGVNISADRLITGCDTLDHLIQRFGRLNRFGETAGVAHLIAGDKEKDRYAEALKVLSTRLSGNETDGYDISPQALFGFPLDENACSPTPDEAELHPWHIDVWSQTSLGGHRARREVEPWLHGQEPELAETYIAWREHVDILADPELIADTDREDVLEEYPLLAHEQLRESTTELRKKLSKLFAEERNSKVVLRRKPNGAVDAISLPKIRKDLDIRDERRERDVIRELAYSQLILPPGCGQPVDGMFYPEWPNDGEAENSQESPIPYDVSGAIRREDQELSDGIEEESRAAYRAEQQENGTYLLHRIGGFPDKSYPPQPIPKLDQSMLASFAAQRGFRFLLELYAKQEEAEAGSETTLLFFGPARKTRSASQQQTLFVSKHDADVSEYASKIASALKLPKDLTDALAGSGNRHDLGKRREIWQRAAGNWNPLTRKLKKEEPVAKPIEIMRGRQLGGFRHELASLLDAKQDVDASSDANDLLLHLIASHHGHGRPCFQAKAYDREHLTNSADEALETARRFARVQRKYGAWGLAYLEAILRAADGLASAEEPEQPPHA